MKQKIKLISGNKIEGQCEILDKLKAEQRILELFETEEIEKIEITYKEKESANTADSIIANNIIDGKLVDHA